ncbi:hypothetical protein KC799_22090 [candidate division KSB1 bacterium]|nr:hypothetical protein [candidate division KSB1 bacterium]
MPVLSEVESSKPDSRSTGRFDRLSDRFTLHFHTVWKYIGYNSGIHFYQPQPILDSG